MSEENVEIVRRLYEGVTARLKTPQELLDRDYEVDARDVSPEFSWPRGFEAAEDALRDYWQMFEDFHVEVEAVIHADEERVVTAVRDGGRMRGSDSEIWNHFFHVWTLRKGKIVRLSIHTDKNRAIDAAGLSE
jgi:ketosteroid isomerase-like protein